MGRYVQPQLVQIILRGRLTSNPKDVWQIPWISLKSLTGLFTQLFHAGKMASIVYKRRKVLREEIKLRQRRN